MIKKISILVCLFQASALISMDNQSDENNGKLVLRPINSMEFVQRPLSNGSAVVIKYQENVVVNPTVIFGGQTQGVSTGRELVTGNNNSSVISLNGPGLEAIQNLLTILRENTKAPVVLNFTVNAALNPTAVFGGQPSPKTVEASVQTESSQISTSSTQTDKE